MAHDLPSDSFLSRSSKVKRFFLDQTFSPRPLIHGCFEYGFVFAEIFEIVVTNVRLPRSQCDRGSGVNETTEAFVSPRKPILPNFEANTKSYSKLLLTRWV
jgi:hypothetical protein